MALPTYNENRNSFGVTNHQTWPTTPLKVAPNNHLVVINHRMPYIVLQNSFSHLFRSFFIYKLGRMAAKKHDGIMVLVFFFQIAEFWQNMETVDAAVCPEVNQNDFVFEMVVKRQIMSCVKPRMATWKFFGFQLYPKSHYSLINSILTRLISDAECVYSNIFKYLLTQSTFLFIEISFPELENALAFRLSWADSSFESAIILSLYKQKVMMHQY